MQYHLTILTGASRGMGLAMAQQLLQRPGQQLLCISRRTNAALTAQATASGTLLEQWAQDLPDTEAAAQRLRTWLQAQAPSRFASATLINNAGVIPPIAPLSASAPADLARAMRVGLEAPLLLCATFLGATEAWALDAALPRKVLNMSSGLGRRGRASGRSAPPAPSPGLRSWPPAARPHRRPPRSRPSAWRLRRCAKAIRS